MAEEQRYEQSSCPILCANNCGFFGSPATMNLCSKCYRDFCLEEHKQQEQETTAKKMMDKALSSASSTPTLQVSSSSISNTSSSLDMFSDVNAAGSEPEQEVAGKAAVAVPEEKAPASGPSRCGTCRKRVGLTGFRCKCGLVCCGTHRYPEQHACTFDFKGLGREAIAKANPLIKADKIDRI